MTLKSGGVDVDGQRWDLRRERSGNWKIYGPGGMAGGLFAEIGDGGLVHVAEGTDVTANWALAERVARAHGIEIKPPRGEHQQTQPAAVANPGGRAGEPPPPAPTPLDSYDPFPDEVFDPYAYPPHTPPKRGKS